MLPDSHQSPTFTPPHMPPAERPNFRSIALVTLMVYLAGWVLLICGGFFGGFLEALAARSSAPGTDPFAAFNEPIPLLVLALVISGLLCFLLSLIFFAVLLHALWKVVQDGSASLSPGAAVCLACIPIVNLVGIFFGFSGLAREINRVGMPMNQGRRLVGEGVALAACICYVSGAVGGCIGCLFGLVGLVGIVLRYVSLFSMCRACEWIVLSGGPQRIAPASPYIPPVQRGNTFDPPGIG